MIEDMELPDRETELRRRIADAALRHHQAYHAEVKPWVEELVDSENRKPLLTTYTLQICGMPGGGASVRYMTDEELNQRFPSVKPTDKV